MVVAVFLLLPGKCRESPFNHLPANESWWLPFLLTLDHNGTVFLHCTDDTTMLHAFLFNINPVFKNFPFWVLFGPKSHSAGALWLDSESYALETQPCHFFDLKSCALER